MTAENQAVKPETVEPFDKSQNLDYNGLEGNEGVPDSIDGIKIIEGKVGGKIAVEEFKKYRESSINNPNKDIMTLGKFTPTIENGVEDWTRPGPDSYVARAGDDSSYFDMGDEWNAIRKRYNLTYDEMFEYFNKPAIKDAISRGKSFRFSHNPINDDGFLGMEWDYIKKVLHLADGNLIERGGMWYVK